MELLENIQKLLQSPTVYFAKKHLSAILLLYYFQKLWELISISVI